jgi:HSP20 family protein
MAASFRPAADFYETAQGCVVRLDVAGVAKEDLSITLVGQELIIRGRRLPPPPQGLRRFIHLEMGFGNFERRFAVPIPVDLRGVEAQYLDGILEVQLPRKKPRQIQITVKEAPDRE